MISRFNSIRNSLLVLIQLFIARGVSGRERIHVLDIGASSIVKPRVALAYSAIEVVAFDPDPRASEDFSKLDFDVDFYPYAVAGSNGLRTLYLTRKSHCSSLLKPLPTRDLRYQVEKEITVKCRTLNSLNIHADIIKIDVQGAELEILQEANITLMNSHAVELEVWFDKKYTGQARLEDIHEFMINLGFESAGFSSLYFDGRLDHNSISFADILYLRSGDTLHGQKVVLVSLIDSSLDFLISKYVVSPFAGYKDRFLILLIRLIGSLKSVGPRFH